MQNSSKRRFAACELVLALFVMAGCQSPRGEGGPDSRPPAKEIAAPDVAPVEAKPETPETPEHTACRDDRDCDGFLRCFDDVCMTPPAVTGKPRTDTPVVSFTLGESASPTFNVELATSSWETRRGLMHRRVMKEGWGMLFVFSGDGPRSFWMENTLIPLDMVFISDAGAVVGVVEGAEPLTRDPRSVGKPARYVLELNAGVAAKAGIVEGATMKIDNAPDAIQPRAR